MNCYSFCVSILGKKLIFFFFKFETVQYENVQQLAAFFYLYKFPVQFFVFETTLLVVEHTCTVWLHR